MHVCCKLNFMKIAKIRTYALNFIHVQLFITLISMPILLAWGMPISVLTFAGNLLLSPILGAFLLLSSIIFFCILLAIPCQPIVCLLEIVTHWWLKLMGYANIQCLIPLTLPWWPLLIVIGAATLAILHFKKCNTTYKSIGAYSLLLIIIMIGLKQWHKASYTIEKIPCNKGHITIIYHTNNTLTLIDPGYIGQRLNSLSWCQYTLMPYLAKKYGCTNIEHCIILQPNKIIFDTLNDLQEKIVIKNIYLPFWQGKLPLPWWISYKKLQQQCMLKQCNLIKIGKKEHQATIADIPCAIAPLPTTIQMQDCCYPCLKLTACVADNPIEIANARYKGT
jgi:hypothetical protein